jgi:DNA-binding SARP family transcriptional activator
VLEVRLLGGLSAAVDGRPVELPADARARELLARLALAPGPQSRSALAGRLRPDVPEESARKTLRSALYELRQALGDDARDAIVATGDRIALAEDSRVDIRAFRRHLQAGELAAAAEIGSGVLLEGLDADWALRAREEHAGELARIIATLAARAEEAGDLTAAAAWARRRLEAEPLAEAAARELIRLLALNGDRPAALAVARTVAERLRTELGVPASATTRALVEDVRRGTLARPAAVPAAGPPALPAALAAAEPPLGRRSALGRLEKAWAEASDGAPRVALISGEPGIGKTTLAGALARHAADRGGAVLLGRCDDRALVPFQPWVEALERLLDGMPPAEADTWLSAHDGALARLLPARGAAPPAPAGGREQYLAFELVRALLDELAGRWPVLLVIDDVHWADADSLALLRHLARSAPRRRLMVALCARPEETAAPLERTLADLRREGPLVHVELAGLDEDAVAAVMARRTGGDDPRTARRLRARSGGNPFFLDALLRDAEETGGVPDMPPAGVREVVAGRLARLGAPTLRALDLAAVCGLEFDAAVLAEADGRPLVEVLEALDGAIAGALVAETDRPGRYAFAHALVGETIVRGMPGSRLARLHLRVADALAARGAGAGEVLRHLRGAGPLAGEERMLEWELAAAREAAAALAPAEAAAHYEAALALTGGDGRVELLLALGDAEDRAGRRARARAAFAEAAELAPNGAALARAALGHGGRGVVIAAADATTVALLERALAAPSGAPATRARLLARLSTELYYADRPRARALSAEAVELARASGDAAALAAALNGRRVALWAPEHADERLEVATAMVAAAEAAGDREATLQGRNWRVVDLMELGRIDEAAAEVDAYAALANEVALPHFRWYVPVWHGALALLTGHWSEARALQNEALELGRLADDPNAPLFVDIQRANAQYAQGRFADMDRERLVREAAASPAPAEWLVNLAVVDAEAGDPEHARRLVRQLSADGGRRLGMDVNWHGACVLAEAAATLGDREAGATLHALLAPHADLFPVVARGVGSLGSAELHLGRLAALLGREDEAVARLRRAADRNAEAGCPAHAATALFRLGELLAARPGDGHGHEARHVLQHAGRLASELCITDLASRAAHLLAAPP